MRVLRSVGFAAILAAAGLAYYVQQRSAQTGEGYLSVVRQLPDQARAWWSETRERATLAIEEGRRAARLREQEVERQIAAAEGREDVSA